MSCLSKHFWIFLLVLASFCVFLELGRMDVCSDNEGQRATPPAEMVRSGNYLIPTLNGEHYLAKPPLLYWMNAASYIITGTISPLTARIPTALCFITLVLCIYSYARRQSGETVARWAAVAFLASPYVLQRSRVTEIDIPLTLAALLAIMAFRGACQAKTTLNSIYLTLLSGVALGAGLLLKGPPILIFMLAAWIAHTLVSSSQDQWLRHGIRLSLGVIGIACVFWGIGLVAGGIAWLRFPVPVVLAAGVWLVMAWKYGDDVCGKPLRVLLGSILTGAAVAAPWAAALLVQKGWPFLSTLIQSEMLERTHTATSINGGSPFYYVLGLLGTLAPWSLLLPLQFDSGHWKNGGNSYRFNLLTGWLSILLFSTIAGKEHEYILPALPFVLMALGVHLAELAESCSADSWRSRYGRIWRDGLLIVLPTSAVLFLPYLLLSQRPSTLIAQAAIGTAVAVALGVYGWKYRSYRMISVAGGVMCVVMIGLLYQAYRQTDTHSTRPIAEATGNLIKSGYDVQAVKMTNAFGVYPGFAFHSRTLVPVTIDENDVIARLTGTKPYFCVLRQKQLIAVTDKLPPELITPRMGPYGRKKIVLIGNTALPPL